MGKLQAMALPAPTLSKRAQKSFHPRVLPGQVSTEKTMPVGLSCPIQLAIGLNSHNNFNIQKEFANRDIDIQLHPKSSHCLDHTSRENDQGVVYEYIHENVTDGF